MALKHKEFRKELLSKLLVFNPVNLHFLVNQLIHVGHYCGALDVHQDEAGDDLGLQGRIGSCG